jgi:hypothetical protein
MRPRCRQAMRWALALGVASVCLPGPAQAQVLVVAEQNLTFGMLTPGVPMPVAPTDVARRAAFTIVANGRYNLTFQLPTHLVSAGGGAIPVSFTATHGRVEIRNKVTTFDPHAGVSIHINPADQDARVYLGGQAQPGMGTRAGSYTATIVMVVMQPGT